MHKFVLSIALAGAVIGLNATAADAAPAWKCKNRHCFWVEGYTGPVPEYAKGWSAPSCPGGYQVLSRVTKKWREVCP